MVALRAYVPDQALEPALAVLAAMREVTHVVELGRTSDGELTLVGAEVEASAIDTLLPRLTSCGVDGDEIEVLRQETSRPIGRSRGTDAPTWTGASLAWSELAMASRQYARAVPQYLVFMGAGGVIAGFGVLTRNILLIVGAMAISPDLLPICAACVGLADGRRRLAGRGLLALVLGLAVAAGTAFLVSAMLRWADYPPATAPLGDGGLGVLPRVNVATVVVAVAAGVVGILAFESRSSSAVGVAISITTIPAAAFAGAAIAEQAWRPAGSALAVLGTNIVMLMLAGTATLLVQRRLRRRG